MILICNFKSDLNVAILKIIKYVTGIIPPSSVHYSDRHTNTHLTQSQYKDTRPHSPTGRISVYFIYIYIYIYIYIGKGKVHPTTGHEGPEGE